MVIPLLAQIFIGWTAIIGSLFVSAFGIYRLKPYWLLAGAVLSAGFAWYLTALPNVLYNAIGISLPLLHIGAMLIVRRGVRWPAALLLLPHVSVAVYFLVLVLTQG